MKKRVSILVFIMLAALVVCGYMLFGGGDFNFGQTNVLGVEENVDVDVDDDGYNVYLKKFSYDSSDSVMRFRVEFLEGMEAVLSFSVFNEDGDVVNSAKYSDIHFSGTERSPAGVVLPVEWSEPGTYSVDMEIVDEVSGDVVYGDSVSFLLEL